MPWEFRQTHRVEFAETDLAGIMHFSNFFRFMERTEHAFHRSLGFSIHMEVEELKVGWPRVHASCDYTRPLRFEDEVEVQLLVREKRTRSITYDFIFRKVDDLGQASEEVARGRMTAVCVTLDEDDLGQRKIRAVAIPAAISAKLQVAPQMAPDAALGDGA